MAKKNTKSRYWVDDNSILPEIVITPQGNYPVLDEAGNPARTVGAIQDINPNAHIYERVSIQPFMDNYIEGETNTAANQRADALDAQVVPHIGDFVSAAAKPLDALMPSRWVGLLDKDYDGLSAVDRFSRLFDENNRGLFINDNPYGLFSKQYAEEHPYWAMAGNMAFDVASTPFIWNGVNKIYNTGKTAVENVPNAMQFLNSPYTGKWTKFGNMEYRFKPGHLGINGTPIESRLFKKPKALRNSKGSIVPTVPEQQMAEEVETALPVRRTSPIYSEPITEGATSSSNRMAETLSPLQESTSGQIPSLRKFREMVRNNDRSVIDLAIADASNALGVDKQFILDYLKKEGIDINTENLHNLASDIRWKLGMEDRNGKIAFNPSYTLRRALKDTYIKALKNDPSIYQPTSDFIKKANLAIDDNKLIEKLADEYLPYLDNTEMNNVFIENILDSSKAFLDVLDNNPDLLRSHLPSYVRDFATKYNLTLEELRNIISGSNDYLVRTTISDWNNTRGYHPNIKQAAGYTPHYDANSGLGIDPISALFVMSRRGSSVHPNISRGDDLRAVADRTKYIFNEAMRPENHFKILESLGTSFSTDSGPLIISRAKKLSNARASRGAFPGAIFPKREYRSSNSFGNVNLGTADAPRIGRVFGASPSPEEILSYPSRQEAVNNMNYKLADFYLTLEKNSQGIPNMPVYGFDTQLLEAVRNAKGNFDLLTPELKQAALNAKFSNGKTPLFAAFPENSDYMNFPDIDIIFSNGGPLTLANKFKDGGSKDDYSTWKKKIGDYKGIIVDGDDTYDYYNFFKDNPQMAWDMLNDNPEAHFTDKYKTPNHPTYSNESIYSRTPYIQGGTWNDYSPTVMEQKWNYALSPSQVNSNWDVERTINYLSEAENEGAYVTDSNGRYPIVDGTVLGGTLTPVTITPNSHSQGGSLKSVSWNDLSMREKADIIRVGVKHGLNRLDDIKSKYNEFAEGSNLEDINLYGKGGKKNSSNRAITISPNVYKAMKFFMDRGMPRVGAAGLVGGFMRESSGSLSPNALNPSSKAIGIAQWLGSRKKELIRRYGSNPTFEQQLEFVWHELNTNYKRALRELMSAKTPTQAADAALGWYEFSVGPMGAVKAFNDTGQDGWGALHKGRRFTHAILGAPYQMPQDNSVQEVQQPMYPQQQYNQPVVMPQNPYPMPMPTVNYQKLAMQQMEMLQRDQEERARQAEYLAEKEQREAERDRRMGMLNLVMSMGAPEESNDNFFNSMLGLAMNNNAKKEETDYSSFNPFSLTV